MPVLSTLGRGFATCTLTNRHESAVRALPPTSFRGRTSPFIALPAKNRNRRNLAARARAGEGPESPHAVIHRRTGEVDSQRPSVVGVDTAVVAQNWTASSCGSWPRGSGTGPKAHYAAIASSNAGPLFRRSDAPPLARPSATHERWDAPEPQEKACRLRARCWVRAPAVLDCAELGPAETTSSPNDTTACRASHRRCSGSPRRHRARPTCTGSAAALCGGSGSAWGRSDSGAAWRSCGGVDSAGGSGGAVAKRRSGGGQLRSRGVAQAVGRHLPELALQARDDTLVALEVWLSGKSNAAYRYKPITR